MDALCSGTRFLPTFIFVWLAFFQGMGQQKRAMAPVFLEGYTDRFTYNPGETCTVFLSATAKTEMKLRLMTVDDLPVDTVVVTVMSQVSKSTKPYADGFGFASTFTYVVPKLKSGLYKWEHTGIHFLVKAPSKKSDIVVLYPYNTEQAYSSGGGKSLYEKASTEKKRSNVVSFLRPMKGNQPCVRRSEGFMRWIRTTDYNFRVISDLEMDDYSEITKSKVLVVIGHSEYWTRQARLHFDRFVNSGKDAVVLSGNVMWCQVRYNKQKTAMICYKDLSDSISNPLLKTIKWNEPSLKYPIAKSMGAETSGYGLKADKGWNGYKIASPASPLLAGTQLNRGQILPCPSTEIDAIAIKNTDADGFPVAKAKDFGYRKFELIGFDKGSWGTNETWQTFIAFQKGKKTGRMIHVGSTDWCALDSFYGPAGVNIRKVTANMIDLLLAKKDIFSLPTPVQE